MEYDVNALLVKDLPEDCKCPICRGLLRNPKEALACQHAFCGTCIDEWLIRSPSCPVCRKFLIPILLGRIHRVWKDKIEMLELKCPNHTRGCKMILHCGEIKQHYGECLYGMTKCPNSRCGMTLLKYEVSSHALICPYRSIYCPVCHTYITAMVTKNHNCISTLWTEMHKELDKIRWEWVKVRNDFEAHFSKLKKMLDELNEEKKNWKNNLSKVARGGDCSQSPHEVSMEPSQNCDAQDQADGGGSVEDSEEQCLEEQFHTQVSRLRTAPCNEAAVLNRVSASCNTANLLEQIPHRGVNGLFIKWLMKRSARERRAQGNASRSSNYADNCSPSNSSINVDLSHGASNCSFNMELNHGPSNSSCSVDICMSPVNSSIQHQEDQQLPMENGNRVLSQQTSAHPSQQDTPEQERTAENVSM